MTVTEKLAHAAERKAFETMLDSLIRKSRTQDVGKVADDLVSMVQKIHSSVWEPETFAMLHKIANDPNSKWAHYAERLLRECDPYLLRTFLTAAAYEGGFRGFQQARANSEKYDCNIPWIVLMDPTSACNMRCAGCWADGCPWASGSASGWRGPFSPAVRLSCWTSPPAMWTASTRASYCGRF